MAEEEFIKEAQIKPTVVNNVPVHHILELTMIDGKVATALSDVTESTLSCPVCGAKPKLSRVLAQDSETTEGLKYGLSTLHCWIRCMEWCLHVSYKLDIKQWRQRGKDFCREKESP